MLASMARVCITSAPCLPLAADLFSPSVNMLNVKVTANRESAEDICEIELVGMVGESLPAFTAGSHIDVRISRSITRQYCKRLTPAVRDQSRARGTLVIAR